MSVYTAQREPDQILNPRRPALVCALCNQKGGVGKTTCTCHLARAACVLGLRVLVLDLDPQGNSTRALSAQPVESLTLGVADAIHPHSELTLADVIVPSIWDGVDLAPTPSRNKLIEAEELIKQARFGRESAVRDALTPLLDDYDLVAADNTPALGQLLINALAAADVALPITDPELWSADGLSDLHETIDLVARHHNPALRAIGPIVNKFRNAEQHKRTLNEEIRPYYGQNGWTALPDLVPQRIAISDYLHAGQGLDEGSAKERDVANQFADFVKRAMTAGGRL